MRGLLGVALAHRRRGRQTEATAAMAELVRSFPDREISYKDYGPEPRDFFSRWRRTSGARVAARSGSTWTTTRRWCSSTSATPASATSP
jgi:hypothetical protein